MTNNRSSVNNGLSPSQRNVANVFCDLFLPLCILTYIWLINSNCLLLKCSIAESDVKGKSFEDPTVELLLITMLTE